ncbi:hypothetical protein DFJ74DRAFT_676269 [Hyaloraphidium curvatum]|nr:hypothetical protein DFJ74DRAFT_676269 [Hyaloraphidium curvatum]
MPRKKKGGKGQSGPAGDGGLRPFAYTVYVHDQTGHVAVQGGPHEMFDPLQLDPFDPVHGLRNRDIIFRAVNQHFRVHMWPQLPARFRKCVGCGKALPGVMPQERPTAKFIRRAREPGLDQYLFEVHDHQFPTCGGQGSPCFNIASALIDNALFHDPSRPAAVPNELLLPIMEALKASGADATLARLMRTSRASGELGLPVLHRQIAIDATAGGGRGLEVWSRYMAGHRREHAFVKKASVTVPNLLQAGLAGEELADDSAAWAFLVRDVLEKLVNLEDLDLDIHEGSMSPLVWVQETGIGAEHQPEFGCSSIPGRLKTFCFAASPFACAPYAEILAALERHAETGELESWTYDGAMVDFALYPSAAQKLRELSIKPMDHDETVRLCGAMGMNLAFWDLEKLYLQTVEGRLAEPFLPLIESRAPSLKKWFLTNDHGLPDTSRFPRAASLLASVTLFTEQDCAALLRSPARPPEIVAPTLLFFGRLRHKLASAAWIRRLVLLDMDADDTGETLSLQGVADLVCGRLPPKLEGLEIEITSERRRNSRFWFTERLAKMMKDAGCDPAFELVLEEEMLPDPRADDGVVEEWKLVWDRRGRSFAAVMGGPAGYLL